MPSIKVIDGRIAEKHTFSEQSQSRFISMLSPCPSGGLSRDFIFDETPENFEQKRRGVSIVESRQPEEDGGRYVGHSFRDRDGRYGSLPLYDNYNEDDE